MHRSKRKRNIIIFSLVGVLLCMVAGYAAFQTQLKVTGSSTVTSNWDIEITHVTEGTPTGSAENAVAPSFDKLWASMEANLYDKGDAMEYDVTIENKGTLDAKLNDILTNLDNSNNEAVIITFSGYTKGEILKAGESKIVHVKIEYNPEYEGGETSSEVEINFDYTQNNNETTPPESTYLLTYDYSTNGGTSVETTEEYFGSGSNVDLSNAATKEGWTFVGWNIDKDAEVGLESYQMPTSNTTLYAIYSKTLKVTYEKDDNVESIGKTEDSCNIYNNQTSCEVTLPEITVNDDTATVGWYSGEENIGKPNEKYTIDKDITLIAQAEGEPYMMARDDNYAFWSEEYRTKIKTIDFVDNKNVPDNAVASWDVSDKKDKSVMAWIINDLDNSGYYKLYIGGTDGVIANENCSDFFDSFNEVNTINLQQLDTSRVTNMHDFFCDDWLLTSIEFGNIDTSQVIDMSGMFGRCYKLETIDLEKFDTSEVTDMSNMFRRCISLTSVDLSNFDTSNVTTMFSMFSMLPDELDVANNSANTALNTIVFGNNFDTSKVTNMTGMFIGCNALTQLDLSNFDTSNVTSMESMFSDCSKLTKLKLCTFNTEKVINMQMMFQNTSNLNSIYVGPNWTTENATTDNMFYNSGVSQVTQSDNCEVDAEDISLEISTTSTTNSITVVANAYADSGIAKYEYSKDGGKTWEESTSNTYTFTDLTAGTSYDIKVRVTSNIGKTLEKGVNIDITNNVVTTGDGLYEDEYEDGRYIYRGTNPDNYIWFNDEMWRIIAKEADGTYKIIKEEVSDNMAFDEDNHRSAENNSYCQASQYGCGVFATVSGTFSSPSASQSGTVTEDSSIKIYLNDDYYVNNLSETAKGQITQHTFYIGAVERLNQSGIAADNIAKNIAGEKMYTWTGNVGLANVSDVLKASTDPLCTSASTSYEDGDNACGSNYLVVKDLEFWTINAFSQESGTTSYMSWFGGRNGLDAGVGGRDSNDYTVFARPVVFLKSNTILSGTGTYEDPFQINKNSTSVLDRPTFTESGSNQKTVTITYPEGCGDSLTCTYQKDNGETINVNSNTVNVEFTDDGSLVATATDGTNTVSSSYTVILVRTINDYTKDNLFALYDGIENTSTGHSAPTNTWYNKALDLNSSTATTAQSTLTGFDASSWTSDNGLLFDGVDDMVDTGYNQDVFGQEFTFSFVVNVTAGNAYRGLYGYHVGSPYQDPFYGLAMQMNGEDANFFYHGSSYYPTGNTIKVNDILNKKQQYTVVYQGGVGMKLYINGKLYNENQANSYIVPYPDANFIIGQSYPAPERYFQGTVYDFIIYKKVLTEEEIQNNYKVDKYRYNLE